MFEEFKELMEFVRNIVRDPFYFKKRPYLNFEMDSVTRPLLKIEEILNYYNGFTDNVEVVGINKDFFDLNYKMFKYNYDCLRNLLEKDVQEKFDRISQIVDSYAVYLKLN